MHRFYSSLENISEDRIFIRDSRQIHHLKDVLRLKTNDEVMVFDDKGNEYHCLIEKILSQEVILKIKARHEIIQKKQIGITLACAIPKGSKMDEIVDKLTQLGVERIIPVLTERVIIRLDKNKMISSQIRWQKIALSASQQSQRSTIPFIEPVKDIREVISESQDYDLKLIPTLGSQRKTLRDIFAKRLPRNVLSLIGPEGDFTAEEIALAKQAGFIPVDLGDLVLRVETACLAMVSFIRLASY